MNTEIIQDVAMIAGGVIVALQCLIWSLDDRYDDDPYIEEEE